ncbi:MAG: hypothetical protein AAF430_25515 [Myxococcota bacterium]
MSETAVAGRLWSDGFYGRIPLPPLAVGALCAALLVGILTLAAEWSGAFEVLASRGLSWWQHRDGRIAVLLALLAVTTPTALRYHELGTRRNLDALAASDLWPEGFPTEVWREGAPDLQRALFFGLTGFALVPFVASLVDGNPSIYFGPDYWGIWQAWHWVTGAFAAFWGGVLIYRVQADARTFAALAGSVERVDLLRRESWLPFTRQGLRSTVPGAIFVTFLALNLVDADFWIAIAVLGTVVVVQNLTLLLRPLRGIRDRLREAKRAELGRVDAAIRGEAGALDGSLIGAREAPGLADLLAWRRFVEAVPEWPIDASTLGRLALYVGIPLFSWVGAALVERMLDAVID